MEKIDPKEKRIINLFIQVCGLLTVILGVSAILGWIFNIPQLAGFDADIIPMALSTAVLFVAYGLIIFFHSRLSSSRLMFLIEVVISSIGILVALVLLYFSLSGIRWNVEHLGLQMSRTIDGLVVGHMSPVTAFCFVFVGLSCLIILKKPGQKKLIKTSLIFAVLVFFTAIIFLLSYILGTPLLYEGSFIPPALTTSLAFLFLGIALLLISGLKVWSYEELSNALSTRYTYTYVLVFFVLIISIMTAGYSYYKSYEKQYRFGIEQQLSSIATLKVNQIVQWRNERLGDANIFYKNAELSGLVKRYINNPEDADAKRRIQEWIDIVHSIYQYESISLHDLKGRELVASHLRKIHSHLFFPKLLSEIQKSGEIIFKDFYRDENDLRIYLGIFIPIQSDNNLIGILDLRLDPEQYLYPLINEWPTPSKTAETLLIRREGNEAVFLNELKFQKNTALNLRRPLTELNLPAARAALGKKEFIEGIDYRGVPVIAYVRPIPDSPWFLVARIDKSEVYAPLREWFWAIVILVVVVLTGSGTSIGLIWRNQRSKFHLERNQSSEKIRKLNRVYAVLSDINGAIVHIRNPQELFEKACYIAVDKGGFQIAWIGKINILTKKVDVVASYGISEEHLKKIDFNYDDDESLLGVAGRAIKTGVHVISNDIENDNKLHLQHNSTVMYGCNSSAAFPLKVFGQVWGVFKLYSSEVGFFDEEELKLLDELAMDISFSIEFAEKEAERKFAEESLRENEEKYRLMFANNPQPMFIYDLETLAFLEMNNAAIHHYGYTREEFLSMTLKDIRPKEDIDALMKDVELTHLTYNPAGEWRHLKKNGELINVEINSHSVTFNARKARHVMVKDITKLKQAKETLIASEIRYRRLFESAKDGILILNAETGKIVDVNPFLIDLLCYSKENLIEKEIWEIGFFKDIMANYDKFLELQKNKYVRYENLPLETSNGQKINVEFVSNMYLVGKQKVIQCNIRDITERKKAELELITSENKYRTFFENSMDAILLTSPDGTIFSANPAACKMFGYSKGELIKLDRAGIIDTADPRLPVLLSERALKGKAQGELTFIRKDGTHFPADISSAIFKNHEGLERTSMIIRDITERKRAEETLLQSEAKLRKLINSLPDPVLVVNTHGQIVYCNEKAMKIFDYDTDEMLNNNIEDLIPKDFREHHIALMNKYNSEPKSRPMGEGKELFARRKGGSEFPTEIMLEPVEINNNKFILAIVRDITERKRAEEESTMLAHSLKSINECVSITDMEDKIIFVNHSFLETYGFREDELTGKQMTLVRSPNNPPELVSKILPASLLGGWHGELWNKRKDGSEFLIYLSTTLIKDKDGKSIGLIGVAIDVTERKRAEKELIAAKERAEESDKLKTEFLAHMSHEIRTPINIILGNTDYLNESIGKNMDSDTRDCFDSIDVASKRIIRTVDLILNVAELQTSGYKSNLHKIDLDFEILNKLFKENQLSAKQKGLEFTYSSSEKDCFVIADEYSITQIFTNLIDNAIKFTKKGKVEILLGKNITDNIIVEIKDTGIGMNKEFLPKLYEPFIQEEQGYSRSYDGNGLGLSLVKKYCEINNAIIEVESEKNVGTTFRVIFKD